MYKTAKKIFRNWCIFDSCIFTLNGIVIDKNIDTNEKLILTISKPKRGDFSQMQLIICCFKLKFKKPIKFSLSFTLILASPLGFCGAKQRNTKLVNPSTNEIN